MSDCPYCGPVDFDDVTGCPDKECVMRATAALLTDHPMSPDPESGESRIDVLREIRDMLDELDNYDSERHAGYEAGYEAGYQDGNRRGRLGLK